MALVVVSGAIGITPIASSRLTNGLKRMLPFVSNQNSNLPSRQLERVVDPMMEQLQAITAAVKVRADERTCELLPMLMSRLASRDGLTSCRRHDTLLYPYVEAQISLTRAKRVYNYDHWQWSRSRADSEEQAQAFMLKAEESRDKIRQEYRSTPCTCWVSKR